MGTVRVTNIERFATHDGPGIRTTVFLKGCPLRCPWCANPETQSSALAPADEEESFGTSWFGGRDMSVDDVIAILVRDRAYYERSGGGITLSGGEPLMHRSWALELLRAAREAGLRTAVETTGNVPRETILAVEPYVDNFLHDFKHIDDERLHAVAGGSGALIKGNLTYLLVTCPERVNVRIPVIPGFNYDDATLHAMLDWLRARGCTKVNLLPYHTLGKGKYERLGWDYTCADASLSDDDLDPYDAYARSLGMESKIGA